MDVRGVAGDKDAALPVMCGEPHADAKDRRPAQIGKARALRHQAVGDGLQIG
jgi:hypothetical protein